MVRAIATINPATGELLQEFAALTPTELETKLNSAQLCFESYRRTPLSQRSLWLQQAAIILERDREKLARLVTLEMGKTLVSARAEVDKCVVGCRYYAESAATMMADLAITITPNAKTFICYQPLGVILAVMPWNYPLWQVFRFAAPALMAGNVSLLKHSSNVPQSALAIEAILKEAGFPQGAFQTLLIGSEQVADLIVDSRIKAATLTGSEPAGASLASTAGHQLKKVVLELGGSDPFIVLPSADLKATLQAAVTARTMNNGQSCIAAKRFILVGDIAASFEQQLVKAFEQLKIGDPMQETTDIGPLATPMIRQLLHQQVCQSVAQGARLLTGGELLTGAGNFYPPTILTDIPSHSPAYDEELFGPVAAIFRVNDLDQAIRLANDTSFGLGASGWTQEPAQQERLVRELEAGAVFINAIVKSDPHLPFGGIKRSGYGRELSVEGLREFVNIKTVWIA